MSGEQKMSAASIFRKIADDIEHGPNPDGFENLEALGESTIVFGVSEVCDQNMFFPMIYGHVIGNEHKIAGMLAVAQSLITTYVIDVAERMRPGDPEAQRSFRKRIYDMACEYGSTDIECACKEMFCGKREFRIMDDKEE